MFRLGEAGLELTEIAPGNDLDRDILQHLSFFPVINKLRPLADVLFRNERMGLLRLASELSPDRRISYNPHANMLFLDFSGKHLATVEDIERVREAVEAELEPFHHRVDAIVNYDGFLDEP